MVKRHTKPGARTSPAASSSSEAAIHVSNVAHARSRRSDKPTEVGFKFLEDGRKVRFARALRRDHRPLGERAMTARLQEHYAKIVRPALMKEFGYKNAYAGAAARQDRHQHGRRRGGQRPQEASTRAVADLTAITGQKPVVTKSRKSIATFKLREGMPIGCQGHAAPRPHVRVPRPAGQHRPAARPRLPRRLDGKRFDGRGNYAMGLKEQIVFPEIDYDKVDQVRGMDIIICTTAKTDAEAKALLTGFDMPFVN